MTGAEPTGIRRRTEALVFGDNPTPAERIAFNAVCLIPAFLPELTDLPDDELRAGLRSALPHILRVTS